MDAVDELKYRGGPDHREADPPVVCLKDQLKLSSRMH
jgi:hypothetical protein